MAFGAFYLRDTAGNPERARWIHLARLGSQSQRAIWFILPARGASRIINCDKTRWSFENTREMQKTRAEGECFLHLSSVLKRPEWFTTVQYTASASSFALKYRFYTRKTIKHAFSMFYTLIKHGFLTNQSAHRVLSIF